MNNGKLKIIKAIVHILDNTIKVPVLSDFELSNISDIDMFLEKHINKTFEDIDCKSVHFKDDNNFVKQSCIKLNSSIENFTSVSRDIASKLYELVMKNPDIPSSDVVFVVFNLNNDDYLGILKLNYKHSFIHFIDENTNGRQNKIIKQKATLPSENQKIDEAIFINLKDFSIILKEKKYDINGSKQFYLSTSFLDSNNVLSDKEKIDIIDKSSKKIIKKYYDNDLTKIAQIKNVIAESIEETNTIDINQINTRVFPNNQEIQNEYTEEIKSKGIEDESFTISQNAEKKITRAHRIITDNNIEIKLPSSYLTNKDKVEFITNTDGSIAIMLKNIKSIKDK